MDKIWDDLLGTLDICQIGKMLRQGTISCEAVTATYLKRIDAVDSKLGAFTYVAKDQALSVALAMDRLLASGTDLGPLMGIPVAIKDLYTVDGMPTTAGTNVSILDLVPPEGSFIRLLKRSGCVIIGKTRTTEFALGGLNLKHRMSWNPCDMMTHRTPGGSSSGSAVAMAAGLCAFSIGTDTGGSVRIPAALCGTVGYKASFDHWPVDGIFPLAPTLDSIGLFNATVGDAEIVFHTLSQEGIRPPPRLRSIRLGKPTNHFFENLAPEVDACIGRAMMTLERAGVELVPIEVPEVAEIKDTFARFVPAELVAQFGRERFLRGRDILDPTVWARASQSFDLSAIDYIQLVSRIRVLFTKARDRMEGLDGWITPTVHILAMPITDYTTVESVSKWGELTARNTRPGNLFGQCAVTLPVQGPLTPLPVGLQIICDAGQDSKLLSIARTIEAALSCSIS